MSTYILISIDTYVNLYIDYHRYALRVVSKMTKGSFVIYPI